MKTVNIKSRIGTHMIRHAKTQINPIKISSDVLVDPMTWKKLELDLERDPDQT